VTLIRLLGSAKGADARPEARKQIRCSSGGALAAATVLRHFFNNARTGPNTRVCLSRPLAVCFFDPENANPLTFPVAKTKYARYITIDRLTTIVVEGKPK